MLHRREHYYFYYNNSDCNEWLALLFSLAFLFYSSDRNPYYKQRKQKLEYKFPLKLDDKVSVQFLLNFYFLAKSMHNLSFLFKQYKLKIYNK